MSADSQDRARTDENPFVGPQSLGRGTRIYGRDKEIRELYRQLLSERFVILHSPSGAGKSSLIYADAGLAPKLKEQGFEIYSVPRFSFDVREQGQVTNRYVFALLRALEADLYGQLAIAPERLAEFELRDYFEQRGPKKADHPKCVLLLDQFEEIFTTDPIDLKAKEVFFRQLGEALRNRENYWALFSLRKEYLAELDIYSHWLPTHLRTKSALTLLTRDAAAEAIQKTSQSTEENYIGSDAAKELAKDLSMMRDIASQNPVPGPFVEPVYLQIVCHSLWEEFRVKGAVRNERMEDFRDVDSVLEEYYADNVARAAQGSKAREAAIRQLFEQSLITEGNTRGQLDSESAKRMGIVGRALEVLEKAYLIRRESRLAGHWLELSHDRLISPIRKSNKDWFRDNRSPLEDRAELWKNNGRSDAHLLSAKDIKQPEYASGTPDIPLSVLAKEYYQRSREVDNMRRKEEEEEELHQIARKRHEKRKFIFRTSAAIIVMIGISSGTYGYLLIKKSEEEQRQLAKQLMDSGISYRDGSSGGNSVRSVHDFALAANKFDELKKSKLASDAQLAAEFMLDSGLPYVTSDKLEDVKGGAFSADGMRLLTWGKGLVLIRNAESGSPISDDMPHEKVVFARFSDDEQHVLSWGGDSAKIWNAETGDLQGDPVRHTDGTEVRGGTFSSDGVQLMTWSDEKLFLWDVSKDGQTKLSRIPIPFKGSVLYAKKIDRSWFTVTLNATETPPLRRIQTLTEKGLTGAPHFTSESVVLDYAGDNLLTWEEEEGKMQYRSISGKPKAEIITNGVPNATLSNDGENILIRDSNGTIQLWEWHSNAEELRTIGRIESTDVFQAAALSATGHRILFYSHNKKSQYWNDSDKTSFRLASIDSASYAILSGNGKRALVWQSPDTPQTIGAPRLWNLSKIGFTLEPITQNILVRNVSANGERFLTEKDNGSVQLQRLNKISELETLADLPVLDQPEGTSFSADGSRLLTWYSDGLVQLWNGEDGSPISNGPIELRDESGKLYDIDQAQFSDDGRQFRISFADGSAAFWDGNDGSLKKTYLKEMESLVPQNAIALRGGRELNWTHEDRAATLLDRSDGNEIPIGYKGKDISGATFSDDGNTLLIWGNESELRLRDGKTGKEKGITLDSSVGLRTAALNDDGSRILTLDRNNVVRLWRATDGRMLLPPLNLRGSYLSDSATYRSSNPRLAFVDNDKQILVFMNNLVYTHQFDERYDIDELIRKVELLTGYKVDGQENKLVELTEEERKALCGHEQDEPENPYSNEQRQHISIICKE